MKNFRLESNEILDRHKLKTILGGSGPVAEISNADSTCTADCGDGTSVSCTGVECTATDYVGCTHDEHEKICPIA